MALSIVKSVRSQAVSATCLAWPAVHRRWYKAGRTG
jgi:hypothetical protein